MMQTSFQAAKYFNVEIFLIVKKSFQAAQKFTVETFLIIKKSFQAGAAMPRFVAVLQINLLQINLTPAQTL